MSTENSELRYEMRREGAGSSGLAILRWSNACVVVHGVFKIFLNLTHI